MPLLKGAAKRADDRARSFFQKVEEAEDHHDKGNREALQMLEEIRDHVKKREDPASKRLYAVFQALVVLAHDQVIQTIHQRELLRLLARHEHLLLHALQEIDLSKRARLEQSIKLELADHGLRVRDLEQSIEDLGGTLGDVYSRLARQRNEDESGGEK